MNLQTLISEGERIAKPSLHLVEGSVGHPEGFWRGSRPQREGHQHWVTITYGRLQDLDVDLSRHFSVFLDSVGNPWLAGNETEAVASDTQFNGIPLVGIARKSFPPLEALCLYGSGVIEEWLKSVGLSRLDAGDIYQMEIVEAYNQTYQARSPLYSTEVYAVLGGWHMLWPDDDTYDRGDDRLVLWTFKDAEPWIEVWLTGSGKLKAQSRIT
jgi:hypothetical protein